MVPMIIIVVMVVMVVLLVMVVIRPLAGLRISIKGFPGRDIAEFQDPRIFGTGLA